MELTTPRSAEPDELYRWVMDFVQRFMAEQRSGTGQSSTGGGSTSSVISGGAVWWPLPTAPEGHVALSGQVLDETSFPVLFSIYGSTFNTGGEAAGTFRLPNMNGKLPKHGATGTGGSATVTLGIEHLPEVELTVTDPGHTHDFAATPHTHGVTDPQHAHSTSGSWLGAGGTANIGSGGVTVDLGSAGSVLPDNAATGITINSASAGGTVENTEAGITVTIPGEGEAVVIDPPWLGGLWIVRAE